MALDFGQLSLRRDERALLIGGTSAGKSTLEEMLILDFQRRYSRLQSRCLIADTKPRFRAEWNPNGTSTKRRYKNWSHGANIPGSVVVEDPTDMDSAWKLGYRTIIVQLPDGGGIDLQAACLAKFLRDSKANRPQLAALDEALDFFHGNGIPRVNDASVKIARAGRERGTAALYCSQRTKGFAPTLLELMECLYCFRLDMEKDAERFEEFGVPKFQLPQENHEFRYWTKRDRRTVYGPYQLAI